MMGFMACLSRSAAPRYRAPSICATSIHLTCSDLGLLRRRLLVSNELLLTWRQAVAAELASGQVVDLPQAAGLAMPAEALALPCALVRLAGRTLSPLAMRAQQWWLANV